MIVSVKLKEYLSNNNLSAYRLVQETRGKVAERTVYALARAGVKRIDLETFGTIIAALRCLTGQDVTPNDLLEMIEEPIQFEEMDLETRAWHDADLAPPLEPYDWGDLDPNTLGRVVINGIVQ